MRITLNRNRTYSELGNLVAGAAFLSLQIVLVVAAWVGQSSFLNAEVHNSHVDDSQTGESIDTRGRREERQSFSATAKPTGQAEWIDPAIGLAKFEVELSLNLAKSTSKAKQGEARLFEILNSGASHLSSPAVVAVPAMPENVIDARFFVEAQPDNPNDPFEKWRYKLAFDVCSVEDQGTKKSRIDKIPVVCEGVLPPRPVEVDIHAALVGVTPIRWVRIDEPTAEFKCRLECSCLSDLPPGIEFLGVAETSVPVSIENDGVFQFKAGASVDLKFQLRHEIGQFVLQPIFGTANPSGYKVNTSAVQVSPAVYPDRLKLFFNDNASEVNAMKISLMEDQFKDGTVVRLATGISDETVVGADTLEVVVTASHEGDSRTQSQDSVVGYPCTLRPFLPERDPKRWTSFTEVFRVEVKSKKPNPAIETGFVDVKVKVISIEQQMIFLAFIAAIAMLVATKSTGLMATAEERYARMEKQSDRESESKQKYLQS